MSITHEIDYLVRQLDRRIIQWNEFTQSVLRYTYTNTNRAAEVLEKLNEHKDHANDDVRRSVEEARKMIFEQENLVRDITAIRRTSPLQPGVRVRVGGGYTAAYSAPTWLGGRDHAMATFLDFVERGRGKMPGAVVEFDEPIEVATLKGKYGILTLRYVADWIDSETVAVHITDLAPEAIKEFALTLSESSEVETHAYYRIENDSPSQT